MFDADDFRPARQRHELWDVPLSDDADLLPAMWLEDYVESQLRRDHSYLNGYALGAALAVSPYVQTLLDAIREVGLAAEAATRGMLEALQPTLDEINAFMDEWLETEELLYPRPKPPKNLFAPRHIPPKGVDRVFYTGKAQGYKPMVQRKGHRHG